MRKDARAISTDEGVDVLTADELAAVVAQSPNNMGVWERREWLNSELAKLDASADDLVGIAVAAMASDDRNVRVKMLRVLALFEDARGTTAVLAALSDPARRVRDIAIKSSRPHHLSPAVIERLRAIVEDEEETNGIRGEAFFVLSTSVSRLDMPEVTRDALVDMMEAPRLRGSILVRLCKSPTQTAESKAILHEFVRTGSTAEAVMATRALCGHQLVRVDGWLPNDVRQRVRATYDAAPDTFGIASCWIPVAEANALAEQVGYPQAP